MSNPLLELQAAGQSVWYDNIERGMIVSGQLQRLIAEDGLRGMTSNPAIFEKAIAGSLAYAGALRQHASADRSALEVYEAIAIQDIQWAADVLLPVYEETEGRDGYISLEVSPHLAHDTEATVEEALRLASDVGRRNLMIKVPGTSAGVPAIERLIGEGLNINVTLLFSVDGYVDVAEAYISGLETLQACGGNLADSASVASFFVSRIDAVVDGRIEAMLQAGAERASDRMALRSLLGKVAIANAKLAYMRYEELISGPRWQSLASQGARSQRLLWASTSVKNPAYRDVLYVEELIGPDTVNTLPEATLNSFRDHGEVCSSLQENSQEALDVMAALEETGISIDEITAQLQTDAVRLFVEPFDKLLASIESQSTATQPKRA
tara:strand:- start:99 stop:1241 length:1143 start_codon:yes stop_codon:yes gene_type:complete